MSSRTDRQPRRGRGASNDDRVFRTHPAFAKERRAAALRRLERPIRRHSVLVQLGAFGVVLILWKIPIVNPIKLLVVLFHEFSHCVAALLTGGTVFGIAIDPGGAGVTLGMGGNPVVVVAAGYVGSLLLGATLCMITAVWEPSEVWGVLFILSCASLAFGWLTDASAVFGYGTVFAIFLCPFLLSEPAQRFLLRLVATASCLYPVIDVAGEFLRKTADGFVVRGQVVGSDVSELARLTGIAPGVLAVIWGLAGLVTVIVVVARSSKKEAETVVKRSLFRPRHRRGFEHPIYDPTNPDSIPTHTIR